MRTLLEGGTFYQGTRWHDSARYVSDIHAERMMRCQA